MSSWAQAGHVELGKDLPHYVGLSFADTLRECVLTRTDNRAGEKHLHPVREQHLPGFRVEYVGVHLRDAESLRPAFALCFLGMAREYPRLCQVMGGSHAAAGAAPCWAMA